MKYLLIILSLFVISCSGGYISIEKDGYSDNLPKEPSEGIPDVVYECDLDSAYDTLWCHCKSVCEERANSKCSSPKECVKWVKLKMNDSIECKCKHCSTEEESNECAEEPIEEDVNTFEKNIERPYKIFRPEYEKMWR